MTNYVLPKACSRSEAIEILIGALALEQRSRWAGVPPLLRTGRATHLAAKLRAYRDWHETARGRLPSAVHLALATDLMLRFHPEDFREQGSQNPWVLENEFPFLRELTEQYLPTLPKAFSDWGFMLPQVSPNMMGEGL